MEEEIIDEYTYLKDLLCIKQIDNLIEPGSGMDSKLDKFKKYIEDNKINLPSHHESLRYKIQSVSDLVL